jgi:ribose transport system ATP-binding protein
MLKALNIDIDPTIAAGKLTVAKQQMVEIAKVLSYDSELLVMDEPSAALTENEIQELFKVIRDLKSRGHGIIYISHRLDELPQISDRITVMRDGQYVGTEETKNITKEKIISMMVGRTIYEERKTVSTVLKDAPVVLKVEHLKGNNVKDVSFELYKGEILGLAGLVGAGRTELARLIVGADKRINGDIYVNGKKVNIASPNDAVRHGIAPHARPGFIVVEAVRAGSQLRLTVRDSGNGVPPDRLSLLNHGVGLANTRARLQYLYREHHQFVFSNVEGGFCVTVAIPFGRDGGAVEPIRMGAA